MSEDVVAAGAEARAGPARPELFRAGLFLVVVLTPLAMVPYSTSRFGSIKLVTLSLGILLISASRPPFDRRIAWLAGAWLGVLVLAAALGVDPIQSVLGPGGNPAGLLLTAACAVLVAVGAAMPQRFVDELPQWLVAGGLAASGIALVVDLVPQLPDGLANVNHTSTLAYTVFFAAFLSVSLTALAALDRPTWQIAAAAALLGIGLALAGERTGLLLPIVALAATAIRGVPLRRIAVIGIAAALPALVMALPGGPTASPTPDPTAEAAVTAPQTVDARRLQTQRILLRAVAERPILGWGTGTTATAYSATATPEERGASRELFGDAHNILTENTVAGGILGTLALLALAVGVLLRLFRAPASFGWLLGALVALSLFHLYEPLHPVTTSLLFLLAGIGARDAGREPVMPGRMAAGTTAIALAVLLVLSTLTAASAVLEQWGRSYYTPDLWAVRLAYTIAPWRLGPPQYLTLQQAVSGQGGDEAAAEEARMLSERMIAQHPWDPSVYLIAARAEALMVNPEGARAYIQAHLERFPGDEAVLSAETLEGGVPLPEPATPRK